MRRASLTFDDGPNSRYTLAILDILKKHRIKACFFLLGENVEYYPQIARRIKRESHLIGNHTYSHQHLNKLKPENILWQIERAEEAYKKILNLRPGFFRPPYGEDSRKIKDLARSKGYKLTGWDCCADDWENPSAKIIFERIASQAKDGSIILLHDGANISHARSRRNTVLALPRIITTLKARGFKFVRLDRF